MMLHHNLRTDAQICGKSATQASLFVAAWIESIGTKFGTHVRIHLEMDIG